MVLKPEGKCHMLSRCCKNHGRYLSEKVSPEHFIEKALSSADKSSTHILT